MKRVLYFNGKVLKELLILILLCISLLNSCKDNTNNSAEPNFNENGTKALLIVVENSYIISPDLGAIYPTIKNSADSVLALIFGIDRNELKDKTLDQIIETYGEDWQIKQIKSVADLHYNRVVVLTDQTANYNYFIDSLKYLSDNYTAVDVILNLHGSTKSILFGNNPINTNELANYIIDKSIKIRALYQTCCYGASTLEDFESAGLYCCNGSIGTNYLTLFSAKLWLDNWCKGATYRNAVQYAYTQEIEEIKKYSGNLPLDMLFLNSSNLESSEQTVKGRYINMLFKYINIIE
jgi:hypothetical protein